MRPLAVLPHRTKPAADGAAAPRPDTTMAAFIGAFALGVVVAAVTLLSIQATRGDTVPAGQYERSAVQLAAARAAADSRDAQVAMLIDALSDADVLARRLVAALDDSGSLSAAERTELRREVASQSRTVEKVRVVRVPVPGPVVTVAPAAQRPQPARQAPPAPAPAPSPPGCTIAVLGTCLAR